MPETVFFLDPKSRDSFVSRAELLTEAARFARRLLQLASMRRRVKLAASRKCAMGGRRCASRTATEFGWRHGSDQIQLECVRKCHISKLKIENMFAVVADVVGGGARITPPPTTHVREAAREARCLTEMCCGRRWVSRKSQRVCWESRE